MMKVLCLKLLRLLKQEKNIRLNPLDRIGFGAEMKDGEWNGNHMRV